MSEEEPYEHVATLAQALDSILDMITKIRNGDREHIADFQIIAVQKWIDRALKRRRRPPASGTLVAQNPLPKIA